MIRLTERIPLFSVLPRILLLAMFVAVSPPGSLTCVADEGPIDFARDVAPILQANCVRCHHDSDPKGDLSFTTNEGLIENDFVAPGAPDDSLLVEVVSSLDGESPRMPPEGEPLTADEVDRLREWVRHGGQWPDGLEIHEKPKADESWWAYRPLGSLVKDVTANGATSIDEFIRRRLDEQGLQRNPPADRRTLIRRATYDLTGMPPTPFEVDAFVRDPNPSAYERLIDRLLASPRYGERWGRHWLDVVRFGESNGFERNVIINNLWPFRDYVIRSINEDKPFDQFIREHLAGDAMDGWTPESAVGTAFLVAGPYDDVGNQDPVQAAQIRANTLDEMIGATGQAFLGLTIACARCHNHKFDPISQQDYYALYATFAGVRHGAVPLANRSAIADRDRRLGPLRQRKQALEKERSELDARILARALEKLPEFEQRWTRKPIDRLGTEDRFPPVSAKFVRLICEAQDGNPAQNRGFRIDEFEVWSHGEASRNVALADNGGKASGAARQIEDFPGAYGPQLAIDGQFGARFISTGNDLKIELARPTTIDRVVFSSAREESTPEHGKFVFVAEYRIEVSLDGTTWTKISSSEDRVPSAKPALRNHRLRLLETNSDDKAEYARINADLKQVNQAIQAVPPIPTIWIGSRNTEDAKGPFHTFIGGSPQKPGEPVVPKGLGVLDSNESLHYQLESDADESARRVALAQWVTHSENPLTWRVLANRVWQYHFGRGIVSTSSDFGYMGARPTHPELLDWLALRLRDDGFRLKNLHRMIMLSQTYRQSSDHRQRAAEIDGDSSLLWRFPPRRLSAEEIRDSILAVCGELDGSRGGPGFRLYRFMQDNVCTYVPLDEHGPETYRRAVYHQNARASVVDLMTEFDQPDCAFSVPRRAQTTTPLQALTMLNHQFTQDMATAFAERLRRETGASTRSVVRRAFRLCYTREPSPDEVAESTRFVDRQGLESLCRVLLNTSEFIYVW